MTQRLPLLLPDNRVPVYYAGGRNISAFRGLSEQASGPEDWVGSLTALPAALLPADAPPDTGVSQHRAGFPGGTGRRGPGPAGSALNWPPPTAGSPVCWSSFWTPVSDCRCTATRPGNSPGPIWAASSARPRAGSSCRPSPARWSGSAGAHRCRSSGLRRLVDGGDIPDMLAAMNQIPIAAGDVVYVPAGLPHAIGPGVMLTELQEPTSFSVLADHVAFGVDEDAATLGLGWDVALRSFDLGGYADRLDELLSHPASGVGHRRRAGARCLPDRLPGVLPGPAGGRHIRTDAAVPRLRGARRHAGSGRAAGRRAAPSR